LRALLAAAEGAGVELLAVGVEGVCRDGRGVTGVRLAGGTELAASAVVLAAGCRSASLGGLAPDGLPPVRPVKGQIVRLRAAPYDVPVTRTVRALVRGWSVYLVPRCSGEVVVGATVEEQGFDTAVTAGGVFDLLRAAIEVVPASAELELVETTARSRPATADNGPVLGAGLLPGLLYATGHFRNGILLAPITAEAVTAALGGQAMPDVARPFTMERFG
jgi:glycine oxidase